MYVLFFVYTFEGVVMEEDLDLVVYLLSDLYLWHAFRCFFLGGTEVVAFVFICWCESWGRGFPVRR